MYLYAENAFEGKYQFFLLINVKRWATFWLKGL